MTDRTNRRAPKLPYALGEIVCHGKELISTIVEQQKVAPKVWTTYVPVKILCLQVEREDVSQKSIQSSGDVSHNIGLNERRWDALDEQPVLTCWAWLPFLGSGWLYSSGEGSCGARECVEEHKLVISSTNIRGWMGSAVNLQAFCG